MLSHLGKREASQMCVVVVGRYRVVVGGRGAVVVYSSCGSPRLWLSAFVCCLLCLLFVLCLLIGCGVLSIVLVVMCVEDVCSSVLPLLLFLGEA